MPQAGHRIVSTLLRCDVSLSAHGTEMVMLHIQVVADLPVFVNLVNY